MPENINNIFLNISSQIMEKLKNDPEAQEIYNSHQNGEKLFAWQCNPAVVESFGRRLAEAGIPNSCINSEGNVLFIAKENDRERVNSVRDQHLQELSSVSSLSFEELQVKNIGGNIHTIQGVSRAYTAVFAEEAKKTGFPVAATDNKDGTFNIHYSGKDSKKAEPVIKNAIASTIGETGLLNTERIDKTIRDRQEMHTAISDPEKDYYFVSPTQPNEYIKFTAEGYSHFRNERLIGDELRSNRNYQIDAQEQINKSLVSPIVLSKEEFNRWHSLQGEERIRYAKSKQKEKSKTAIQHNSRKFELERLARELAEYKMSFENNSLNTNFHDSSISRSNFLNNEFIADKRTQENGDRETELSVSYPQSLPPDIQVTIDKYNKLPPEEIEYVDSYAEKYTNAVKETSEKIVIEEVNREDLTENLDVMIASLSGDEIANTTTIEVEEREI